MQKVSYYGYSSWISLTPCIDTVERNILDLAARQGLSLYTKENSAGTLNVAALSTDADFKIADTPKKLKKKIKGDFISKYAFSPTEHCYRTSNALFCAELMTCSPSYFHICTRNSSF